ncbi:MAG: DUF1015 domain-containing protein, partial [Clostridiales bacterium]|nr:DUF1015 domain-containing protein [Clostridiales bacterium]
YDYSPCSASLIRATEGTILDRIPPRARVREGAALELPHVLMLVDDPGMTLIEPLWAARADCEPLYDVQLMMGGGRLRGWRVPERAHGRMKAALSALEAASRGMMYAVGDGNHSLAAARAHWAKIKESLPPDARPDHPARYALVELTNLHGPAMQFEPIHRALFRVDPAVLLADLSAQMLLDDRKLADCAPGDAMFTFVGPGIRRPLRIENAGDHLPLRILQTFLDQWLSVHPEASIDYVHGEEVLSSLAAGGACGFLLRALDKRRLFPAVRDNGPLPRKAFSMGRASEKRYYMECRRITPAEG